jgi:hypothetical protein
VADPVEKVEATLLELEQHADVHELTSKLRKRLKPILDEIRAPPILRPLDEWSVALRAAARTDLDSVKVLVDPKTEGDHAQTVAMLLQMAFEKIAKCYLAETDPAAFRKHRRSHAAARRFIQIIKKDRTRRLLPQVGPQSNKVLSWVEALTDAHPALAKQGPHLEYPWEENDRVGTPGNDLFIVNEIRNAESLAAPHLYRFASQLVGAEFEA